MTGLWLLQLHIMLSQKGRGRGGGGELLQSATAAYKSYAPARARRSLVVRSLPSVSRFAAKRQPSSFSFFLVLSLFSVRLSLFAVEEED